MTHHVCLLVGLLMSWSQKWRQDKLGVLTQRARGVAGAHETYSHTYTGRGSCHTAYGEFTGVGAAAGWASWQRLCSPSTFSSN